MTFERGHERDEEARCSLRDSLGRLRDLFERHQAGLNWLGAVRAVLSSSNPPEVGRSEVCHRPLAATRFDRLF